MENQRAVRDDEVVGVDMLLAFEVQGGHTALPAGRFGLPAFTTEYARNATARRAGSLTAG